MSPCPQVRLAKHLTLDGTTRPESIAILSPYNAQVSEINKSLLKEGIRGVTVCTIMKSQGEDGGRGEGWLGALLPSRAPEQLLAETVFQQIPPRGHFGHEGRIPGPGFWVICDYNKSFGNLWGGQAGGGC